METAISYLINPLIKEQTLVDGTLGGGGYTDFILSKISKTGRLISIDKDENAIEHAKIEFKDRADNLTIKQGNFADIKQILFDIKVESISGLVLDLGLSSYQLNNEDGFSFLKDSSLDMRADKTSELTAFEIINKYNEYELKEIFSVYGEIHNSGKLAAAILKWRKNKEIHTTLELVKIIQREYDLKKSIPHKFFSKIFQALRIAVNDELNDLKKVLEDSLSVICEGGRIVIISYHSLEDRIVKEFFKNARNEEKKLRILTKKVIKPEFQEIRLNRRARSAKLRAAEVEFI